MVACMHNTVTAITLAGIAAFREMPAGVRAELASRMFGKAYQAGSSVIAKTDNSRDVFFLVAGRVRATLFSRSGKEITFQDLEPGDLFGELSAIDGQDRSTNVIALSDCFVATMRQADFLKACNDHPQLNTHILRRLAALSRMLMERVYEFSTLGVNNRVHAELLRLARKFANGDGAAEVEVTNAPTHSEIANRVSTHREAVTRELKRLEGLGVIEWGRSCHRILDIERLAAMVHEVRD